MMMIIKRMKIKELVVLSVDGVGVVGMDVVYRTKVGVCICVWVYPLYKYIDKYIYIDIKKRDR